MSKPFKQLVRNVQGSTALVESKKGNVYPVIISDYVRLKKEIAVGDTAIVNRLNGTYYLIDVEPKVDETESCLAEVPLDEIGYDY